MHSGCTYAQGPLFACLCPASMHCAAASTAIPNPAHSLDLAQLQDLRWHRCECMHVQDLHHTMGPQQQSLAANTAVAWKTGVPHNTSTKLSHSV
jgi:hypothetical protein